MTASEARRRLLMMGGKLNTSPKIAQYDKSWGRGVEVVNNDIGWCITEWYEFIPSSEQRSPFTICGYVGNDANQRTFQYYYVNTHDWYYFNNGNAPGSRNIDGSARHNWRYISFSIDVSLLNDSYAYVQETGQIIFAGKNSIYYGYKNINYMPTA